MCHTQAVNSPHFKPSFLVAAHRRRVLVGSLALSCLLVACSSNSGSRASDQASTQTSVDAGSSAPSALVEAPSTRFVTDRDGRALILRGTNINSSSKNTGHVFTDQTEHSDMAHDVFGFNVVRMLVQWAAIEPKPGEFNQAYLDEMVEAVDKFHREGMYVMVDLHQDLYAEKVGGNGAPDWAVFTDGLTFSPPEGGPWYLAAIDEATQRAYQYFWNTSKGHPELREHYLGVLRQIAGRLKDNPGVVAYDIMNEPVFANGTLTETLAIQAEAAKGNFHNQNLTEFTQQAIEAIREVDPDTYIAFEPTSLINAFPYPGDLIASEIRDVRDGPPRLIYAPHLYETQVHDGGPYGTDNPYVGKWEGFRSKEATELNAALFFGEFGGPQTADGFSRYIDDILSMADRQMIGFTQWDYSTGSWGPLTDDLAPSDLGKQLARPYPMAVAGTPNSFSFDPASKRFDMTFTVGDLSNHSTEVALPALTMGPTPSFSISDARVKAAPSGQTLVIDTSSIAAGTKLSICVVPEGSCDPAPVSP